MKNTLETVLGYGLYFSCMFFWFYNWYDFSQHYQGMNFFGVLLNVGIGLSPMGVAFGFFTFCIDMWALI